MQIYYFIGYIPLRLEAKCDFRRKYFGYNTKFTAYSQPYARLIVLLNNNTIVDMSQTFASFDEYFSQFTPEIVDKLKVVRNLVNETAPDAVEVISYNMPAFKYQNKILIYFAAFQKHIGFYALPSGNETFAARLSAYKTGKGSVQFPYVKPLPLDLMRDMVVHRMREIELKLKKK